VFCLLLMWFKIVSKMIIYDNIICDNLKKEVFFMPLEDGMSTIPVLIVGAGPTGLTMAVLLKRLRIAFRIIDKQKKPVTTSDALAVQTRTLEVWDDLDFLSSALNYGNKIQALNIYI